MRWAAGPAAVLLLAGGVIGCGDDHPDPGAAWTAACGDAAARIAALPTSGTRDTLGLAAGAVSANLRDLAAQLQASGVPGGAPEAVNLRNAVAQAAVGYADLEASIRGIGSGGRARVLRDVGVVYRRIEVSAAAVGLPACGAGKLGGDRFTTYLRATRVASRAEPLSAVAARVCGRLRDAYGPNGTPVDQGAALTQVRRSRAVLGEVRGDLDGRSEPAAARLRAATLRADGLLGSAEARLLHGANPGVTVVRVFARADDVLRRPLAEPPLSCTALG